MRRVGVSADSADRLLQLARTLGVPLAAPAAPHSLIADNLSLLARFDRAPFYWQTVSPSPRTAAVTVFGNWTRTAPLGLGVTATPAHASSQWQGRVGLQGLYSAYVGQDRLATLRTGLSFARARVRPYLPLPEAAVVVTSAFNDSAGGADSGDGAVSTATWTGVPLGAVLERAGLGPDAQHLWMEALDRAPIGTVPKFLRSIPREVALGDALLAYGMNGGPIPLLHGGPLRLIVPGWYGMTSTQWLTHVHARPTESDNHFMARGYKFADGTPVRTMLVKSVIATPGDGQRVRAGRLTARGQAWSGAGAGGIRAVDVSTDDGRTWRSARLVGPDRPGAWRSWEADVDARPGTLSLMARATDGTGRVQPVAAPVDAAGYGNNSIHRVRVHVA